MNNSDGTFESANRVYDKKSAAPTIPTCGGGGIQPKVLRRYCMTVAMRKREAEQKLEPHDDGISNAITTVSKDNMTICKVNI